MRITSLADYQKTYELSVREPEKFWAGIANEFEWSKPFTKVLDWNFDDYSVKWFEDGQLNITTNCLDRHLKTIPDQAAIIYEPNEPGDEAITLTYRELHARVCKVCYWIYTCMTCVTVCVCLVGRLVDVHIQDVWCVWMSR
jgi:acetyl-CoA synthetase